MQIEVGKQYRLKGSESTIEVVEYLPGAKVEFKVVDPPPREGLAENRANMTEDEFLSYVIEGMDQEDAARDQAQGKTPPKGQKVSQQDVRHGRPEKEGGI